ncbi:beta-N-acetylhexosaminidase [Rhodalgimonas zhirmunskyi]|uniref:beta-N-acetylhexosaminidase n=1 Tax=Rhodalgimonas zhirmunskyi TaxID=2964767 RepID=A0AAJ1X515_9RHOB|nr:beta-N-acetylhexosaminidase [Rhodoalgimonas zhirmunskyi]MDQ2093099.1 beta-N-acetylhexosaminidase [Rhodoalgimonas zhirmunskyi]
MGYGATILDAEGTRLTADEKAFFRDADPFGFILFARNLESADQIRALCSEMRDAVGREALISIDQEGGRVQRLRPPLARDWNAPLDDAIAAGAAGPEAAARALYIRYRLIAHELRGFGIDSNCAPLIDVARPDTHPFLRNRCYGTDPQTVANIGRNVAQAHLDGGVVPIVKHIPGHGAAINDSHYDLPRVAHSRETLQEIDFAPFHALNDFPLGMTAHVVYESYDLSPATLSPVMMQIVREKIGFDGLIMTDDISMKALSGDLGQLSRDAIAAGCDVILHCNGTLDERRVVAEAAGRMPKGAQERAERAIAARKTPDEIDIAALDAELEALLKGAGDD